jgi:hypothetical protein
VTPVLRGRCMECGCVFLASEAEQHVDDTPTLELDIPAVSAAAVAPAIPAAPAQPRARASRPQPSRTGRLEKKQALEEMRSRSLFAELKTILRYPLVDPVAYLAMAVFVAVFSGAALLTTDLIHEFAVAFSAGVLMAYAFTALIRVSDGNLKNYMPNISDIEDLTTPLSLAFSSFLASFGPFLIVIYLNQSSLPFAGPTPVVERPEIAYPVSPETAPQEAPAPQEMQRQYERLLRPPEPRISPVVMFLLGLTFLWGLFYAPAAMIAAGVNREFAAPLNFGLGLSAVLCMGRGYLEVLAIFIPLVLVQSALGWILRMIPGVGFFFAAFTDAYLWLCIGCTLGLGLFKHSEELGLKT